MTWQPYGTTGYEGGFGTSLGHAPPVIYLWRKGQKCQWRTSDGTDVGPQQSNVAPALAWAHANGYHDPALRHLR